MEAPPPRDDQQLIIDAWKAGRVSRETLANVMKVSVPSVGRLLRRERALKADERNRVFEYLYATDVLNRATQPDFVLKTPEGTMVVEFKRRGVNLPEARRQAGLTLAELARRTGITEGEAYVIEAGDVEVAPDWQMRIAEALGREVEQLFPDRQAYIPAHRVPLIGAIPAGNLREALEDPLGLVPCDVGGPNTFALIVDGDSMDQIVPSGTRIYVDPDDRRLLTGKLYAVINGDGETTFKRFAVDPARLEPVSSNPTHRPIMLEDKGYDIIGRVVGAVAKFD